MIQAYTTAGTKINQKPINDPSIYNTHYQFLSLGLLSFPSDRFEWFQVYSISGHLCDIRNQEKGSQIS